MNFREYLEMIMETQIVTFEQAVDLEQEFLEQVELLAQEAEWQDQFQK